MKCFYHNDLDGRCSAHCVYTWATLSEKDFEVGSQFIEMNYNKRFPIEVVQKDESVWIVDYSISVGEMKALLEITPNVVWIDHHKTSIEKYADFPAEIKGVRISGEGSGAMLTYKYLHLWTDRGKEFKPEGGIIISKEEVDIPEYVQLVSDWDEWKFEFEPKTKRFKNGCELYDHLPKSDFWFQCLINPEFINEVASRGETVVQYRNKFAENFLKSWSFETQFEGYKCVAANVGLANSDFFSSVGEDYEILMPFVFDGKRWSVSMYSKSIDVGAIAKKYGGGGHFQAAGFVCDQLPFGEN
jgi:uncharacterized protein